MTQLGSVSYQAFMQELQNWEMTLTREIKKLKQLKKISNSKLQLNTIDITLLAIESELMQYRKVKDKKMGDNLSIIEMYSHMSKRFMGILEKVGESADSQKYQNTITVTQDLNKTQQNGTKTKNKHFLQETFTYNMSKQPSRKKTNSVFENKRQLNNLLKEKNRFKEGSKLGKSIDGQVRNKRTMGIDITKLQFEQEQDLSDIRYQLKEIKSMLTQMDKEIRLHNHDQIQKQLSRISHNGNKLNIQVKAIKDDNQFLLARMQNLKDQINHEKQIQNQMVKQFETGKHNKSVVNQLSKQHNTAEQVSEWVKVRI